MNTNRHFNPGGPTHLTGRKYVCGPCAAELGKAVGLVDSDKYIALETEMLAAKEITRIAEERLLAKEDLVAAIKKAMDLDPPLYGLTVEKPEPKPAKKSPAKPVEKEAK